MEPLYFPKIQSNFNTQKDVQAFKVKLGLSIGYLTSSLQSIWLRVSQEGTDILRDGHRDLLTEMVDSVKILEQNISWIMSFGPPPVTSFRHCQTFLNAHFQLSPRPMDGVAYQATFEIV